MAKSKDLITCFCCKTDCSEDFVSIEKNYIDDMIIFIDVCRECFDSCADDKIKKAIYQEETIKCAYCNEFVLNEQGETIISLANASGQYCAVTYSPWKYSLMHIDCYENNIDL